LEQTLYGAVFQPPIFPVLLHLFSLETAWSCLIYLFFYLADRKEPSPFARPLAVVQFIAPSLSLYFCGFFAFLSYRDHFRPKILRLTLVRLAFPFPTAF